MGKIKTKLIKRTSKGIFAGNVEVTNDFTKNKKILKETMPSKKVRNQIAGYLTRIYKNKEKELKNLEATKKN
jgi:ribosomal protein S17E